MSFIELELIEELFIPAEKQDIIAQLKDGMVRLRSEGRSPAERTSERLAETKTE